MIKRLSEAVFPKPALCPEKQPFQTAIIVSMIKARDEDQSVPITGCYRICRQRVSVISVPFLNRKTSRPSSYTSTGEGETFMVCQLFSPYGETWAVLTSDFQTFSSLSAIRRNTDCFERVFPAIRRKTCCFDQVFSQNFFCFLHHTEKRMPFC